MGIGVGVSYICYPGPGNPGPQSRTIPDISVLAGGVGGRNARHPSHRSPELVRLVLVQRHPANDSRSFVLLETMRAGRSKDRKEGVGEGGVVPKTGATPESDKPTTERKRRGTTRCDQPCPATCVNGSKRGSGRPPHAPEAFELQAVMASPRLW